MRILLACQQSPRQYALPAYGFWREYFVQGGREAEHELIEVPGADWAFGLQPLSRPERGRWLDEVWTRTLDVARTTRPDLFLGYLYPLQVEPRAIAELNRCGIPTVNFFCDNVREFRRVPKAYHDFTLHWVPEYAALPLYRDAGLKAIHAPMPVWVPPSQRTCVHEERFGPTFIGSRDRVRQRLLAEAIARGAAITVRGRGWSPSGAAPSSKAGRASLTSRCRSAYEFLQGQGAVAWWRRYAAREPALPAWRPERSADSGWVTDYVTVTQQSSVVIGINRFPSFRHPSDRPPVYSRLRDLEAPMMGACYLTEWAPGLDQLYELGSDIEVYRDAAELAAQLSRLSADPAHRRRLRAAGQRRALGAHTIGRSLEQVRLALGLSTAPQSRVEP